MSQALLIFYAEFVLCIGAKLTIIRRVQKNEVVSFRGVPVKKFFKVQIFDHCIF